MYKLHNMLNILIFDPGRVLIMFLYVISDKPRPRMDVKLIRNLLQIFLYTTFTAFLSLHNRGMLFSSSIIREEVASNDHVEDTASENLKTKCVSVLYIYFA